MGTRVAERMEEPTCHQMGSSLVPAKTKDVWTVSATKLNLSTPARGIANLI